MMKRRAMTESGRKPPARWPGRMEEGGVGRPKRYLTGPDLVISQERARERTVLDTNTTGRDPAREVLTDKVMFVLILRSSLGKIKR